jgi:hypothetical protein
MEDWGEKSQADKSLQSQQPLRGLKAAAVNSSSSNI